MPAAFHISMLTQWQAQFTGKIGCNFHFMFPGHMTVSGVMLCSSSAGQADWLDMKDYWQNDDEGVADRPAGPPGRT